MSTIDDAMSGYEKNLNPLTKGVHELQTLAQNGEVANQVASNIIADIKGLMPVLRADHENRVLDVNNKFYPTKERPLVFNYYFTLLDKASPQFQPFYEKVRTIFKDTLQDVKLDDINKGKNYNKFVELVPVYLEQQMKSFLSGSWKSEVCIVKQKSDIMVDERIKAVQVILFKGADSDPQIARVSVSRYPIEGKSPENVPQEGTEVFGYLSTDTQGTVFTIKGGIN